MSAFNLAAISAQLPPNTGPPGTVSEASSSGSSSNNKNLSHVPCKFFRQGVCQAGGSCPFSHNLEGTLAADKLPCKYFQKGNCKFGLKCALAHFLPDGTRVNSKNMLLRDYNRRSSNSYQSNNNAYLSNNNQPSYSSINNQPSYSSNNSLAPYLSNSSLSAYLSNNLAPFSSNNSQASYPHSPGNLTAYPHSPVSSLATNGTSAPNSSSSLAPFSSSSYNYPSVGSYSLSSRPIDITSSSLSSLSASNNTVSFVSVGLQPLAESASSSLNSNSVFSHPGNLSSLPTTAYNPGTFRSLSVSTPLTTSPSQTSNPFGINAFGGSSYKSAYNRVPPYASQDSAIADDGGEDIDENGYFEDYVPGSLGDLILTPQEMQRRDSRSQSGTLLVRPNINSIFLAANDAGKKSPEAKDCDKKSEKSSSPHGDVFLME